MAHTPGETDGGHVLATDLDGTLIYGFSIVSMFRERVFSGKVAPSAVLEQLFSLVTHGLNGTEYSRLLEEVGQELAGTPEEELIELGETVFDKHLAGSIYPESRALVRAHLERGHTVAIATSATAYQANAVAPGHVLQESRVDKVAGHGKSFRSVPSLYRGGLRGKTGSRAKARPAA